MIDETPEARAFACYVDGLVQKYGPGVKWGQPQLSGDEAMKLERLEREAQESEKRAWEEWHRERVAYGQMLAEGLREWEEEQGTTPAAATVELSDPVPVAPPVRGRSHFGRIVQDRNSRRAYGLVRCRWEWRAPGAWWTTSRLRRVGACRRIRLVPACPVCREPMEHFKARTGPVLFGCPTHTTYWDALKAQIGRVAERMEQHRKRRLAAVPALTITRMYNVVEQIKTGTPHGKRELADRRAGRCLRLAGIHQELDALVADAYGWPWPMESEEILERLVKLHDERAYLESQGRVAWLRPE